MGIVVVAAQSAAVLAVFIVAGLLSVFAFALFAGGVAFALICLSRAIFGRELVFGAMSCDAIVDSVPDSTNARIITVPPRADQADLNHALYEHPDVPPTIADWIINKLVVAERA
jgi:hypothetical protein